MNILITGSNGFIGKNLCYKLSEISDVTVFGMGKGINRNSFVKNYIEYDISIDSFNKDIITRLQNCDVIIHTAACIDKDDFNSQLIDVNCRGTNNILNLAKEINCKKIIYISSIPVIGIPTNLPITENHITKPNTLYHITKLTGEYIVNQAEKYNILPIILRIPSPVGIGMNPKTILPIFLKQCILNNDIQILGNGSRKQNYIDIRDIEQAVQKCLIKNVKGCFNIASNKTISNLELAELCIKLCNSHSRIIFSNTFDKEENVCWDISIKKAKEYLDYMPLYSIEDTIKVMIEEYRKEII